MPRLTDDQWAEIRAKREGTGVSFKKLADEYGVSDAAIVKRASSEGWSDGSDGNAEANRRAFEKVSGIVSAANQKARLESIETAADIKADVIKAQQADWSLHRETFGPTTMEEFDRLKCAKISAEMLKIRHEGERKAYGIAEIEDKPATTNDGGLTWAD